MLRLVKQFAWLLIRISTESLANRQFISVSCSIALHACSTLLAFSRMPNECMVSCLTVRLVMNSPFSSPRILISSRFKYLYFVQSSNWFNKRSSIDPNPSDRRLWKSSIRSIETEFALGKYNLLNCTFLFIHTHRLSSSPSAMIKERGRERNLKFNYHKCKFFSFLLQMVAYLWWSSSSVQVVAVVVQNAEIAFEHA